MSRNGERGHVLDEENSNHRLPAARFEGDNHILFDCPLKDLILVLAGNGQVVLNAHGRLRSVTRASWRGEALFVTDRIFGPQISVDCDEFESAINRRLSRNVAIIEGDNRACVTHHMAHRVGPPEK